MKVTGTSHVRSRHTSRLRNRFVSTLALVGVTLACLGFSPAFASDIPAQKYLGSKVGVTADGNGEVSEEISAPPSIGVVDSAGLSLSALYPAARSSLRKWPLAPKPTSSNLRSPAAAHVYSTRSDSVVMVYVPDQGFGSGVVVERHGQVLTNWHVVGSSSEVLVLKKFDDPDKLKESDFLVAEVISTDPLRDLAVVRLRNRSESPAPVPIGALSNVVVGTDVVAIGHPSGLSWTLTEGVVSQIRRNYEWQYDDGSDHRATVIQTQTSINPGSSGGPLFNAAGELVGLNSFSASGESLNFAVASNEITDFISDPPDIRQPKETRMADEPTVVSTDDDNNNGVIDTYGIDADGDGTADYWAYDEDEDGEPEAIAFDQDGDGFLDTVGFDSDYDGHLDTYLIDSTGDGEPDTIGVDMDGDGYIDGYRQAD